MLTLRIDLLTGVYRAALPDGTAAEWPPHPERVFSALVQSWADGDAVATERRALEWLEALDPPDIEASGPGHYFERIIETVYVPPNDMRGDELSALPDRRLRQARTFAAAIPASRTVQMHWHSSPPAELAGALETLAARVASVGHSSSLVRCVFALDRDVIDKERRARRWTVADGGRKSLRVPYAGRLLDLTRWFSSDGKPQERPRPRRTVRYEPPRAAEPPAVERGHFGGPADWFIFQGVEGWAPDLLAFPHVARRVRDALMSLAPQPVAEVISGHQPAGSPSTRPHLAVVPLANLGWRYSTGDLLGFAVVLPTRLAEEERRAALAALARFARVDEGQDVIVDLHLTRRSTWHVRRAPTPGLRSLSPARWCARNRTWATATPIVLDRFPDGDDPIGEARLIAAACRNIGLPEPIELEIHKHSALVGAPSAYPARRPAHPTWSFPHGSKLSDRPRRHAILRFDVDVQGPVLLGAGRYQGFGLCAPLGDGGAP